MPLLNIDIPALANARPGEQRASLLSQPIAAQVVAIAALGNVGTDASVRDQALAALAALQAPAHIGLDALRVTAQVCARSAVTWDFRVAALSTTSPDDAKKHQIGKWYPKLGDRWMLSVTAQDMARAAAAARGSAAGMADDDAGDDFEPQAPR